MKLRVDGVVYSYSRGEWEPRAGRGARRIEAAVTAWRKSVALDYVPHADAAMFRYVAAFTGGDVVEPPPAPRDMGPDAVY